MSILDKSFRYTPAVDTDVTRLFKRVDPQWNVPPRKRRNVAQKSRKSLARGNGTLIRIY